MADLRKIYAEMRKQLPPEAISKNSQLATAKLAEFLLARASAGATIGIYKPAEPNRLGEIDPSALARDPRLTGFHFAFPRVINRFDSEMDFAIPAHPTDWVNGVFGNAEPGAHLPGIDPTDLEIIVVPGVVFGPAGERIGMGAGFYDRYLIQARGALRVGVGHDFQFLSESIPQEEWDARMDVVVTELRVRDAAGSPGI